jgi:transposase-like protein
VRLAIVSGHPENRLKHSASPYLRSAFFAFPPHLRRKLRTTNVIERCFVEVRRRTRPMVCFVNLASMERIVYAIFQRFNQEWKHRILRSLHMQLDITFPYYSLANRVKMW